MVFRVNSSSIEKLIEKHRSPFKLKDSNEEKKVKDVLSVFRLSGETVLKIADIFTEQMDKGLNYDGSSPLAMQNTFVYSLLDGSEEGKFLGLDLGGTNFRVILIELSLGKCIKEEIENYEISEDLRTGSGIALFDYISKCVLDFAQKHDVLNEKLPLGFTFSFPISQSSLDCGILLNWIGQYNATGVVGNDVVVMLKEAFARTNALDIDVVAVINDTTGTLLRGSLIDKETAIALILGTGSNACFFEKTSRMAGWTSEEKQAVLNIEWGSFPDSGLMDFIQTKYDQQVDANSMHPRCFLLEKYIGGKFFGEIVRLVLCELIDMGVLFGGKSSGNIRKEDSFLTPFISAIERDNIDNESSRTESVLRSSGVSSFNEDDIRIIKFVCEELSIRMALLCAACLGEIVKRIERPRVTVAVDGSLYKYHPRLHTLLNDFTNTFVGSQQTVHFILVEDGSGVGAALVAAMATRTQSTCL